MKKSIFLIFVGLILSLASFANTYLIYRSSTGGTWTNTAGIASPVPVNLSTVNGGSEASLNAWFADRRLATPTMGGGSQFVAGDQVWIIGGTYLLTDTVKLCDGVSLYGGFSGAESAISGRVKGSNAWAFTNETILDGNAATVGLSGDSTSVATIIDGFSIQNCKNSTSKILGAGAKISGVPTMMQNCIIRNCNTTMTDATTAGGIVLTGGATVKDCYIHDNTTSGYGAGVTICGNGCKLSGCKITNNTAAKFGGGVCLYSNTSGVTVSNCDISNNTTSSSSGGGLLVFSTTVVNADPITISNCTFTSNSSTIGSGGALYMNTKVGNVVNVSHCTFTSNTSGASRTTTTGGGAIWISAGTHNIDHCTFTNNSAPGTHGGALLVASSSATATISNSVFSGNVSASNGYGSALMLTFSAKVNNCLIYGNKGANVAYVGATQLGTFNNTTFASNLNTAGNSFVGIYLSTPTAAANGIFTNCLFYNCGTKAVTSDGTVPTITYCGFDSTATVAKTLYTDASNIYTVYASSYMDAANNDYHLAAGSTAIDAGTSIDDYETDLAGVSRPYGSYDMGAYEYDATYVGIQEAEKAQKNLIVYRNSNNMIAVSCDAEANAKCLVSVYNLTGKRLLTQQLTNSTSVLNKSFSPGIYLVSVQSGRKTSIQKIVIE